MNASTRRSGSSSHTTKKKSDDEPIYPVHLWFPLNTKPVVIGEHWYRENCGCVVAWFNDPDELKLCLEVHGLARTRQLTIKEYMDATANIDH